MCIVACIPASPDPCRLCYSKLSHLSVLNEFSFLPDCLLPSSPKARQLLPRTLPPKQQEETGHRQRSKTYASPQSTQEGGGGPRTLKDYQQIAAKSQSKPRSVRSPPMEEEEEGERVWGGGKRGEEGVKVGMGEVRRVWEEGRRGERGRRSGACIICVLTSTPFNTALATFPSLLWNLN